MISALAAAAVVIAAISDEDDLLGLLGEELRIEAREWGGEEHRYEWGKDFGAEVLLFKGSRLIAEDESSYITWSAGTVLTEVFQLAMQGNERVKLPYTFNEIFEAMVDAVWGVDSETRRWKNRKEVSVILFGSLSKPIQAELQRQAEPR